MSTTMQARAVQSARDRKANAKKRSANGYPKGIPPAKRQRGSGRAVYNRANLPMRALAGKGRTRNATTNRREFVIEESEYVAEVTPANEPAFNCVAYNINPGQVNSFPWLSTIAKNFEKYCFEYLEFFYKREVSEFATNGQTGKVIYSFDTDASDPLPFGKQEMEATDPHQDALPSENFSMVIPPRMLVPVSNDAHFVRSGALPTGTDIKTYDVGMLNVATQGTAANTATGELHVRYRVRLIIPVLPPGGSQASGVLVAGGGSLAAATPFGAVPVNTGAITLAAAATDAISIQNVQVGQEISVMCTVSGTVLGNLTYTSLIGLTLKTSLGALTGASAVNALIWQTFLVTALNPSLILTFTATTVTGCECQVSTYAPQPSI